MRLAAHQPDLLPYPGFWEKMMRVDVFDLAIWDQFQRKGYQRRVRMRGQWCSIPVEHGPSPQRICDVRLLPQAHEVLLDTVYGRYVGSERFDEVYGSLHDWMLLHGGWTMLWEMNLSLLLWCRQQLSIPTPVSIACPPMGRQTDGLLDLCQQYPGTEVYLSGDGGRAYMGDDAHERFDLAGVRLEWMNYESPTADSVLTLLMDGMGV